MTMVHSVRFANNARNVLVYAGEGQHKVGDPVIVETQLGLEMGWIAMAKRQEISQDAGRIKGSILRAASDVDFVVWEENKAGEDEAFAICRDLVDLHGLDMNLVAAEYSLDGEKLIFYFTSPGRVDFRQLVRDLAARFHMRIELRQIGVRDDAKKMGGVGVCGRELCCSSWLDEFTTVSIRMAKDQDISISPSKVSGSCGRLLCCLAYEHEVYQENKKLLPRLGTEIKQGRERFKVVGKNVVSLELHLQQEISPDIWGTTFVVKAAEFGYGKKDVAESRKVCADRDHCAKREETLDKFSSKLVLSSDDVEDEESRPEQKKSSRPKARAPRARRRGKGPEQRP